MTLYTVVNKFVSKGKISKAFDLHHPMLQRVAFFFVFICSCIVHDVVIFSWARTCLNKSWANLSIFITYSRTTHPITGHVLLLYSSYHMVSGDTCRFPMVFDLGPSQVLPLFLEKKKKEERAHVPNNTDLMSFLITTDEPSVSSNSRSLHSITHTHSFASIKFIEPFKLVFIKLILTF